MEHAVGRFTTGLRLVAVTLSVLVALPLLVVLVFVLRPVLMVGIVGALVGSVVLYLFSPRFRAWLNAPAVNQNRFSGLRLSPDIDVHASHSWARFEAEDAAAAVGVDDLLQATLGPVEAVELPSVGRQVNQGDCLFSLRRGNRTVDVRAPLSGIVLDRNVALLSRPWLINTEPFTGGWAVRLDVGKAPQERQTLLRGARAEAWFQEEIDRLFSSVLVEKGAAPTLADGGTLAGDLHQHIDDRGWKQLKETFFGNGGTRN